MTTRPSAELNSGDLVLHVPSDGSRGSGPIYLDRADNYGGDETRVEVSWLVSGPLAWTYGLQKDEVVPVGHVDVEAGDRLGNGFTMEALKRFAPEIKKARQAFYVRYPNFEDGRSSVHISELKWPMRGYMGEAILPELIDLSKFDIRNIKFHGKTMPIHNGEALIVHAVPRADNDAFIEPTAIGRRNFTVMRAHIAETDASPARSGYFATSVPSQT